MFDVIRKVWYIFARLSFSSNNKESIVLKTKETPAVAIKPLLCTRIEDGGIFFTAAAFPGENWSLGPLQKPEHVYPNLRLASDVGTALSGLGVHRAYAPNPTQFNGKIIAPKVLDRELLLPCGRVHLFRNQDIPADGTWLRNQGDALVLSSGGCGTIVATLGDEMIAAHLGRDSAIDRIRILSDGEKTGRRAESVVDNIVSALASPFSLRKQLRVWVFNCIKPEHFAHRFDNPEHSAYNKSAATMLRNVYGSDCGWVDAEAIYIDIPKIVQRQFRNLGVGHVSLEHAYLPDELPTTRNGGGRYLAAIVRDI